VTWDGVVRLRGLTLEALAAKYGGRIVSGGLTAPVRILPIEQAGPGDLAPWLSPRLAAAAHDAAARGAALLTAAALERKLPPAAAVWVHDRATWALASVLDDAVVADIPAMVGPDCEIGPGVVLGPRVVIGSRVRIGAGTVIGHPGFGWAFGEGKVTRAVPQLAGVVIENDVAIGPLSTIDAGTLSPTRIRHGAKLDAHVHVGHNADIGEGAILAAQCGLAGSVRIGPGALLGGQVGIADHVFVGAGARIAAKSGVIGDVPAGATFAGYPAVPRFRWLRALARLYRGIGDGGEPWSDD
jgi:UDP-3-O-[3-hydroxymyristoyl] glucosamine N-acyltransferase